MLSTRSPFPTTRHPIQLVVISVELEAPAIGCASARVIQIKPIAAKTPNSPTPANSLVFISNMTRARTVSWSFFTNLEGSQNFCEDTFGS